MINNFLISILMPCYNSGKYLKPAVASILNQTYSNFELILIDDGSTDNTRELIDSYAANDTRIVTSFNHENIGLIKTLNIGIALAKGTYIARMDSDDISELNRIEVLLNALLKDPDISVISAGFIYISVTGKKLRRVFPKAISSKALKFVAFFSTPVNHPCSMIKTELLKANPYDEQFIHSEDYEIFSRFLLEDYKVINLPDPLYQLRVNPESVSFKFESIQISTHTKISARNIERYFHRNYDFFLHRVMINRINFNVNPALLSLAFRSLDELKSEYCNKEKISNTQLREINEFLNEQKIDLLLQSLKYARFWNRLRIIFLITANSNLFISERGLQYLKSKAISFRFINFSKQSIYRLYGKE